MTSTWTDYIVLVSAAAMLGLAIMYARGVVWQLDERDRDSRKGEQ